MEAVVESITPSQPAPSAPQRRRVSSTATLARRLGLRLVSAGALTIRRRRRGRGFSYYTEDGRLIRDRAQVRRLNALAVPPAYEDVLCAEDPSAHLQAIGRDAAGRLQYRYHPEWEKVREARKAHRLAQLVEALPRIRRSVAQHLAGQEPTRELALAGVIELVARSAIRPGSESYARLNGTRGAATLLKSNVTMSGDLITLAFRAKGGKHVRKEFSAPRLCAVIELLRRLPGRRLFQYRGDDGTVRPVRAQEVNAFLRNLAGVRISLKDFRTLCASASALEALARTLPAASARQRRKQVLDAVREVAAELHNTPAICRRSYVHDAVVSAFENGVLERFATTLRSCRSAARKEQFLAEIVAAGAL
ncbi:MAG TPA: DNA topoisomerase IB [Xanthobacteraceae bacterium]|nr:DNA topoisomerase IB [Xanthobacteraceae bacterium]